MKNVLFFAVNKELPFTLIDYHLRQSYNFILLNDFKRALQLVCNQTIDLCIVERTEEGIQFIKSLKIIDEAIPTLLIATTDSAQDKGKLFDLNCTEYMFQPFLTKELTMRMDNALNSVIPPEKVTLNMTPPHVTIGNSVINFTNRTFKGPSGTRLLTTKESELLKILHTHKNKLVTRSQILLAVWKKDNSYTAKSMDVYLAKLRKIMSDDARIILRNHYGTGYILSERDAEDELIEKEEAILDQV